MRRRTIDLVDRQVIAPVTAPLSAIETFDQEYQRQNTWRNRGQPFIELIGLS